MSIRIIEQTSTEVEVFAPAKINLFLAITGKRDDGYHQLSSLMAKLALGDILRVRRTGNQCGIQLTCPGYAELENPQNLVFRAASKWFEATGESWGMELLLKKQIPALAGLGGGSSDAVSTLVALNELGDSKLTQEDLVQLSAEIGSDCPSFFVDGLCVAEGRGEYVRPLPPTVSKSLVGQKVLLFRPNIGFSTAEIYQNLAKKKKYSTPDWAKDRMNLWEMGELSTIELLHNDLENVVFSKHLYYPVLFQQIEEQFGLVPKMSGSGSACFVLIPNEFEQITSLKELISNAFGADCWVKDTEMIS
jgi:4-diphosphocytidyl-2-C-methyl-D-erythritol kinase